MFIDFREKGKETEREKNITLGKKHQSVDSCMSPDQELNPQPRDASWPGIEPAPSWCTGQHSNQLNQLARAETIDLIGTEATSPPTEPD